MKQKRLVTVEIGNILPLEKIGTLHPSISENNPAFVVALEPKDLNSEKHTLMIFADDSFLYCVAYYDRSLGKRKGLVTLDCDAIIANVNLAMQKGAMPPVFKVVQEPVVTQFIQHIRPLDRNGNVFTTKGATIQFEVNHTNQTIDLSFAFCKYENFSRKAGREQAAQKLHWIRNVPLSVVGAKYFESDKRDILGGLLVKIIESNHTGNLLGIHSNIKANDVEFLDSIMGTAPNEYRSTIGYSNCTLANALGKVRYAKMVNCIGNKK